jgi:hypothetical protein
MKSFLLKIAGREQGPYPDTQIAQMFADRRVNRYTPCKPASGGDWRTIDDFLPTLKYGTQLPPPTAHHTLAQPLIVPASNRIAIVDLDIPFLSILRMMFKWVAAAFVVFCCFLPIYIVTWLFIMAVIGWLMQGALHH